MKVRALFALMACCAGCQFVRLSDYNVCDQPDCSAPELDAGAEDAGLGVDGGSDGGALADAGPSCVPDGSVDVIDALGDDSDCDGVDGVRTRQLYVAGDAGNDATAKAGNPLLPFATLKAAFSFLRSGDAGAFDAVLVTTGRYDEEDVTWDSDVDVHGGRLGSGTWPASGAPTSLVGGNVGLVVQGVFGHEFSSFQVIAAPAGPSKASIGAVVVDGTPAFLDVELVGGEGGAGLPGVTVVLPDAGAGLTGTPSTQGQFTQNPGPPGVCGGTEGFAGGPAASGPTDGKPGAGPDGGVGGPPRSCLILLGLVGDGAAGTPGDGGLPGADAVAFGSLDGSKWDWVDSDGVSGTAGTGGEPGSGGGGGGGSGIAGDADAWSGGSGGSGGCPGGGGGAGMAGGPSFGLVVRGGRPMLSGRTTVRAGRGGAGGAGAPGGSGFPGGSGGQLSVGNVSLSSCGPGGRPPYGAGGAGGNGGAGGSGGPGGGGAGGHAIGVFCENDAGFDADGGVVRAGVPGDGGSGLPGARGGLSAVAWGCSP